MRYKDKLTGKEFTFSPKSDMVMVKLSAETDSLTTTQKLHEDQVMTPVFDTTPSGGYGCFRLTTERDDVQTLSDESNVEAVFPVVVDNEGNERYFLPGEITVQFKEGISKDEQERIISAHDCEIQSAHLTPGYYTLDLPAGKGIFEAVETFNSLDEVLFAEPSNVGYNDAQYLPNDPDFSKQYGLHNSGQTGGTVDADVDAPCAWNMERGESDIVIAVIDTGVDLSHQDLKANLLPRPCGEDWDFADPDLVPDPGPESFGYHGTHCAGIAAAVDNEVGIVGLAPGCSILPIRIDLHGGKYQNRADAINFVTSIADRYGHVIMSCSWVTTGDVAAIRNAIANANNKNILVCFAAGNDYRDTDIQPRYPGVMTEVLSVAATDDRDVKASFSNYGTTVDVSAPGVDVYSTLPGDSYGDASGTSMSCPLVAGLAGLIWSRNPELTHEQVRTTIEDNCDNIDAVNPGYAGKLGSGRINACKALQAVPKLCEFKIIGKFPFPQNNAGSSSALTFYYRFVPWPWIPRTVRPTRYLLFLTQQPWSERIYFLHPLSGAIVRSIDPHSNDTIGSMTWDRRYIRVANVTNGAGSINSIDPSTGAQISSIPAPSGRGEGLTTDGKYLFYSTISTIHQLRPTDGAVVRSFPAPGGGRCYALTSDGRNLLFSGDPFTNEIVIFEKHSLHVVCRFDAPGGGTHKVHGLAYDRYKKLLYIANQGENMVYYGKLVS